MQLGGRHHLAWRESNDPYAITTDTQKVRSATEICQLALKGHVQIVQTIKTDLRTADSHA